MQSCSDCGKSQTYCWKIKTPGQIQILGPSLVGKSKTILDLLEKSDKIFDRNITQIIYAAPCALKEDFQYISKLQEICKNTNKSLYVTDILPQISEIKEIFPSNPIILILDDLTSFENLKGLSEISSLHAHHSDLTVLYSLQNCFQKTRKLDLVHLNRNLTGRFIFISYNDYRLYQTLNSILFPDKKGFLIKCLTEAKKLGINYVYINTHPHTCLPRRYICYTSLFSENNNSTPEFFDLEKAAKLPSSTERKRPTDLSDENEQEKAGSGDESGEIPKKDPPRKKKRKASSSHTSFGNFNRI